MTSERGDRDRGERGDRGGDRERGGDRGDRRGGGGGGGGRFRRPRGCEFCRSKVDVADYKDTQMVRRYITESGKMEPRRKVGTCSKHQRMVSQAVKRARHLALIPYTSGHVRLSGGMGRR